MLGAVSGDVIGSIYELKNIKSKDFPLFSQYDRYTDDTVMTCAIAEASMIYALDKDKKNFRNNCIKYMKEYGLKYIDAGYGGMFIRWLITDGKTPYYSYGNGSAMRVSSVAYAADSLEEAESLAEISAAVTHNHPEGIKGAKAVASAIWLLKNGASKEDVKKYIEDNYYKLNFKIDDIRKDYRFDVSCQGSVPQAIEAFLESSSFEDSIRTAISIGGDSDTIGAITGSLSEAYYGIPMEIQDKVVFYLDDGLKKVVDGFYSNKSIFDSRTKNM